MLNREYERMVANVTHDPRHDTIAASLREMRQESRTVMAIINMLFSIIGVFVAVFVAAAAVTSDYATVPPTFEALNWRSRAAHLRNSPRFLWSFAGHAACARRADGRAGHDLCGGLDVCALRRPAAADAVGAARAESASPGAICGARGGLAHSVTHEQPEQPGVLGRLGDRANALAQPCRRVAAVRRTANCVYYHIYT